ncbi:hypothetical protein Gotur_007725, partial [Gossypium turneri]
MGWNHPDISLEEMMKLIEGFVDILVLSSGYQSSGLPAHWDFDNIKRAFQWALFFENKDCHDGIVVNGGSDGLLLSHANSNKLIIDTDPGIDDSMAIFMAFQNPEYEILGLTTIFGNVQTEYATRNALLLCEIAGRPDVPVAQGSPEPLTVNASVFPFLNYN